MRTFRYALVVALALFAGAHAANAQSTSMSRHKATEERSRSKFSSGYKRQRDQLGVYMHGQSQQYTTRLERIRMRLAVDSRYVGLTEPPPEVFDPMTRLLYERNLLSSRSALGDRTSAMIGRNDYIFENGRWRGAYTPLVDPIASQKLMDNAKANQYDLPSQLEKRLNIKADEFYHMGVLYFKERRFIEARNYFDLVKQLEPDGTRGYIASILVSSKRGDINQTFMSLMRAIQRAKSIDDIKIDRSVFYPKPEDFQREFDRANLQAKSEGAGGSSSLLLAFYATLYDDYSTALSATEAAVKFYENQQKQQTEAGIQDRGVAESLKVATQFRDFLQKTKTPSAGPSIR